MARSRAIPGETSWPSDCRPRTRMNARWVGPVITMVLLSGACTSGSSSGRGTTSGSSLSTTSTGAGGAGGCSPDMHVDPNGACVSTIAWTTGPNVPTARNHHMTWLIDAGAAAFLYVAGGAGANTSGLSDVERAPVNADGTLGAWQPEANLPTAIIGAGVAESYPARLERAGRSTAKEARKSRPRRERLRARTATRDA